MRSGDGATREVFLRARMDRAGGGKRLALLNARHSGEPLGRLARELALCLYDRMGL